MKISELLDRFLAERRKQEYRKTNKWRVSELGQCLRKCYLKRINAPCEPLELRVLRVFEVGNVLHKYIQDLLEAKSNLVAKEGEVENDLLRGHFDAVVKEGDKYILYEFKSVHSRKFHFLRKRKEMDKHHIKQAMAYLLLLQNKYPIKEARIVYFSKDDLCIEEQSFFLNDKIVKEILDEVDLLEKYWKEKQLPPAKPIEEWSCRFCEFTQCPSNKSKKVIKK